MGFRSFDPSASYTITVYNDDPNFAYNISAAIYMSSCGFYDPSSETWSGAGCYPTAESLPVYTTCMCNHLTPFGGSMLVPPNAISFSDLVVSECIQFKFLGYSTMCFLSFL